MAKVVHTKVPLNTIHSCPIRQSKNSCIHYQQVQRSVGYMCGRGREWEEGCSEARKGGQRQDGSKSGMEVNRKRREEGRWGKDVSGKKEFKQWMKEIEEGFTERPQTLHKPGSGH